ncbi:MAG: magnesium transporter [Clostridia bacterium]|nr:magnesium transporter [Clostridia bacterium]MBQ9599966.1 magnesium transporter [Clostridia bacterium]MBR0089184.1 magnesium transporter [Clostridia bacterium]
MTDTIERLLSAKKYASLRDVLSTMNEADIAVIFEEIDNDSIPLLFRLLPKDLAADTFALMDSEYQEMLIRGFSDNELKEVFDELYVDDAADIVEEMPANVVKRILKNTDPETRHTINEILKYPEDSAGSVMTTDYISLRPKMTVSDAIKRIRRTIADAETAYICFVTNDDRTLIGYLPIKDLLLADEDKRIKDIMDQTLICVHTHDDKEQVARDMSHYDFAAMPVVDDEGRLVGIVTFDDAIDVLQDEVTEDIERMAAIAPNEESYFKTSDIKHARNRIVWLLVLMLSAAITGTILTRYEEACSSIPLLVAFIPMLMSTGGNCGSQSSTMIIRGMSLDEIKLKDFFRVVWTELRVSVLIGVVLSVVNGIRIWIMNGDLRVATVVSLSVAGIVIVSQFIGCTLPMLAKRCKLDPAVMAAPLITTIVDAASILIYFSIATRFFNIA